MSCGFEEKLDPAERDSQSVWWNGLQVLPDTPMAVVRLTPNSANSPGSSATPLIGLSAAVIAALADLALEGTGSRSDDRRAPAGRAVVADDARARVGATWWKSGIGEAGAVHEGEHVQVERGAALLVVEREQLVALLSG